MDIKINAKRIMVIIIVIISLCWPFLSFVQCQKVNRYKHPDFQTNYSGQEHIERIEERIRERYSVMFEYYIYKDVDVYLLHSLFDDDQEYFIVEISFYSPVTRSFENPNYDKGKPLSEENLERISYTTDRMYCVGYIRNDVYYRNAFRYGKSSYTLYGFEDQKKYYGGGYECVMIDGKMICLNSYEDIRNCWTTGVEYHLHKDDESCVYGCEIEKNRFYDLMFFEGRKESL